MTTTHKKALNQAECPWESGTLGASEDFVRAASPEEMSAVDDALGLQMISIRLQKNLLESLKEIAKYHGIGYQPMIRDLLNRFARSEVKTILEERLSTLKSEPQEAPMRPVEDFLERERKIA